MSLTLTELTEKTLYERRERVFLVLAGVFFCAMTMLNIIGITRIVDVGPLTVAVGVLPYPVTFLCTDLISELYGRARANFVVMVGLGLNGFIIGVLWVAQALPATAQQPPWQTLELAQAVPLPNGSVLSGSVEFFDLIYFCTTGAVLASMIAYMTAQFIDVYLFHFWKRLTRGRHLWLRNNLSTLCSQMVDSVAVMTITFGAMVLGGEMTVASLLVLIFGNYLFKFFSALIDTLPLYFLVGRLSQYLQLDPLAEFREPSQTGNSSSR